MLTLFAEEIHAHKISEDKVFPHERLALETNYEYLKQRNDTFSQEQQKEAEELQLANNKSRKLDREMIALKPEIIQLYKQRQHHAKWLVDHGKGKYSRYFLFLQCPFLSLSHTPEFTKSFYYTELVEINRLLEKWSHEMTSSDFNTVDVGDQDGVGINNGLSR